MSEKKANYVKWGLPIDVSAVYVNFFVVDQSDYIVDVSFVNRGEQNVLAYLLDRPDHFF